jgi:hypothetical protein
MRSASSAALLDAQVRMTKIVLQALEARIVGLKKLVCVGRLLVVVGWVRGCARLYGVHSVHPFCGPGAAQGIALANEPWMGLFSAGFLYGGIGQ